MMKKNDIKRLRQLYYNLKVPLEKLSNIPKKFDKATTKSFYLPKEQSPLFYRINLMLEVMGEDMTLNKAIGEAFQMWADAKMVDCLRSLRKQVQYELDKLDQLPLVPETSADDKEWFEANKRKRELVSLKSDLSYQIALLREDTATAGAKEFRDFMVKITKDHEDLLLEAGIEIKSTEPEEGDDAYMLDEKPEKDPYDIEE